jgi:serine/threonine protein kinase
MQSFHAMLPVVARSHMLQDEEHAYIVQELCAGGDLKSLLDANGCVSEVEAATIMRGVLDMLVELHRCVLGVGWCAHACCMFADVSWHRRKRLHAVQKDGQLLYCCFLIFPQPAFSRPTVHSHPYVDLPVILCLCSKSICYADLKPANIMFSEGSECPTSPRAQHAPQLQVRAVDFGCSRVAAKGRPLTQCCGSPLYMAPEMALQRFGVGVDMWAAGVMVSVQQALMLCCSFYVFVLCIACRMGPRARARA